MKIQRDIDALNCSECAFLEYSRGDCGQVFYKCKLNCQSILTLVYPDVDLSALSVRPDWCPYPFLYECGLSSVDKDESSSEVTTADADINDNILDQCSMYSKDVNDRVIKCSENNIDINRLNSQMYELTNVMKDILNEIHEINVKIYKYH